MVDEQRMWDSEGFTALLDLEPKLFFHRPFVGDVESVSLQLLKHLVCFCLRSKGDDTIVDIYEDDIVIAGQYTGIAGGGDETDCVEFIRQMLVPQISGGDLQYFLLNF